MLEFDSRRSLLFQAEKRGKLDSSMLISCAWRGEFPGDQCRDLRTPTSMRRYDTPEESADSGGGRPPSIVNVPIGSTAKYQYPITMAIAKGLSSCFVEDSGDHAPAANGPKAGIRMFSATGAETSSSIAPNDREFMVKIFAEVLGIVHRYIKPAGSQASREIVAVVRVSLTFAGDHRNTTQQW